MRLKGLKQAIKEEKDPYTRRETGSNTGGFHKPEKKDNFDFKNTDDLADTLIKGYSGVAQTGVDIGKKALAAVGTPRKQLLAAVSGRGAGLGFGKQAAQDTFMHFRKELPDMIGGFINKITGIGPQAPGRNPVGSALQTMGGLAGKAAKTLSVLSPLKKYLDSAKDEGAMLASAAVGDFRNTSVLGNAEYKQPEIKTVRVIN
jgi:hypothetical protein